MRKKQKLVAGAFWAIAAVITIAVLLHGKTVDVLSPAGSIASQQRNLIFFAVFLGMLVIIPVFYLTFHIVTTYHDGNKKAAYTPDWDGSRKLEAIWWGIPMAIILILAITAWRTSHSLDPFKAISATKEPMTIQVIAMQYKWLFIYPEDGFASVNHLEIPERTPISFQITSDAPMNSFWIPRLGGQVYAMSGMSTQLHLIASKTGYYYGYSANLSGEHYADMRFTVKSVSQADFNIWHSEAHKSKLVLDQKSYDKLVKPGSVAKPIIFGAVSGDIFGHSIDKYMRPEGE